MIKVNNFFIPSCVTRDVAFEESIKVNCDMDFIFLKIIFKDIEKIKAICNFIEHEKINEILNKYANKKGFENWEKLEESIEKECYELFEKHVPNKNLFRFINEDKFIN